MTYYSDFLKYKRLYEHMKFVLTQANERIKQLERENGLLKQNR